MGSGSFLEALGAEEHMREKQGVGSVFIKEWEPALCPALFQKTENAPEFTDVLTSKGCGPRMALESSFPLLAHRPAHPFLPVYCCCSSQGHPVGCRWAWLSHQLASLCRVSRTSPSVQRGVLKMGSSLESLGRLKNVQVPGPCPGSVRAPGVRHGYEFV